MLLNVVYLALSLLTIYLFSSIKSLYGIVIAIIFSYGFSKWIKNNKLLYFLAIILSIVPMMLAKLSNVISIMGLSYFSLQIISYLIDVYNGKEDVQMSFIEYSLYIAYFPRLFIGPIDSPKDFKKALNNKKFSIQKSLLGLNRIIWGLFKKLVIASKNAIIVSTITSNTESYQGIYVLVAVILYSFELYSDFSGGVDIVLGCSDILGLTLSENFNNPFSSETVSEFWRRWHITLGAFLRNYVYIPLGGNKKGKIRKYMNTIIVFLLSGLWHGLNYMLWGMLNGILVCTGNLFKTRNKLINRFITFMFISLMWVFFIYPDNILALRMLITIFSSFNYSFDLTAFSLSIIEYFIIVISLIVLFVVDCNRDKIRCNLSLSTTICTLSICLLLVVTLLFGNYGIGYDVAGFIYSKF